MSALAKERVRARARAKARKWAKAMGGLATIAVSKDTLHESVQLLRERKGQELAATATVDTVQPWLHRRPGNSKGKDKGPDQSYGKGGVSVMGQEGLFNFPQLGCGNPWTTTVKATGQDGWLN